MNSSDPTRDGTQPDSPARSGAASQPGTGNQPDPTGQPGAGAQPGPNGRPGPNSGPWTGAGPQPTPPSGAWGAGAQPAPSAQPGPAASFFDSLRRAGIVRTEERWIGGVAGGLARRLGVDPVLVRCAWIVLAVLTGLGPLLYGLAWAFLPEERDGRIHTQQALDGDVSAGLAGAIAMTVAGLGTVDSGVGLSAVWAGSALGALTFSLLWPVLWITLAVVVVLLVARSLRDRHARRRQPAPPAGPPSPSAPDNGARSPYPPAGTDPAAEPGQPWPANPAPAGAGAGSTASTGYPDGVPFVYPSVQTATSATVTPSTAGEAAASGTNQTATGADADPTAFSSPSRQSAAQPAVVPPQSPAPRPVPRPRRPRVPGPGRRFSLVVLALGLLASAGILLAVASRQVAVPSALVLGTGILTALLGAGVLVSGLRGRRATWMTALGWLAAAVCVPALALASLMPAGTITAPLTGSHRLPLGDVYPHTLTVTDAMLDDAPDGILDVGSYSAGALVLDLTQVTSPHPGARITASLGAGTITVSTRESLPVRVQASYAVGHVYGQTATQWTTGPTQAIEVYQTSIGPWPTYDLDGQELLPWTLNDLGGISRTNAVLGSAAASKASTRQQDVIEVDATVGVGGIRIFEQTAQTTWQGAIYEGRWIVSSWSDDAGTHHSLAEDWPVPGMTHPAVTEDVADQCLVQATDWARQADADGTLEDSADRPTTGPYADGGARYSDLWISGPEPWALEQLSPRSARLFTACLDHVTAGGSADDFDADEAASQTTRTSPTQAPSDDAAPSAAATAEATTDPEGH